MELGGVGRHFQIPPGRTVRIGPAVHQRLHPVAPSRRPSVSAETPGNGFEALTVPHERHPPVDNLRENLAWRSSPASSPCTGGMKTFTVSKQRHNPSMASLRSTTPPRGNLHYTGRARKYWRKADEPRQCRQRNGLETF